MKRRKFLQRTGETSLLANPAISLFSCFFESNQKRKAIRNSISEANLTEEYKPWYGDCWHIAVALFDVFDELQMHAAYHPKTEEYPLHVFVEYDSTYYDGRGVLRVSDLIDEWENIYSPVPFTRARTLAVPWYSSSDMKDIREILINTEAYTNWSSRRQTLVDLSCIGKHVLS